MQAVMGGRIMSVTQQWNDILPFQDTPECLRVKDNFVRKLEDKGAIIVWTSPYQELPEGEPGQIALVTTLISESSEEQYEFILLSASRGMTALTEMKILSVDLSQLFKHLDLGYYDRDEDIAFEDASGYFQFCDDDREWLWYDSSVDDNYLQGFSSTHEIHTPA